MPEWNTEIVERYHAAMPSGAAGILAGSELLRTAYHGRFLTRPVFLDAAARVSLGQDLGRLLDLLAGLPQRLFDGDLRRFAAAVGMAPVQAEAAVRGAGTGSGPVRSARADLYRTQDGFQLIELNVHSALGGFENAEMHRALLADPAHRAFVTAEGLAYSDTLRGIVDTMLAAGGGLNAPGRPVVALVDWPPDLASEEPRLRFLVKLLRPMGLDAVVCHLGQVSTGADRGLYVDGRRIDVVYRFFGTENLLEESWAPAAVARIQDAVDDGTVRLFTGMDAELYASKAALALLGDERNREAFTATEREFLDRFVPLTRRLCRELIPDVLARQGELVLKPVLMHGGKGVVAGWTVPSREWARQIEAAAGGPYVVQRRVRPAAEPFPAPDGSGGTELMALKWGVFLNAAGYGGAFVHGAPDLDIGVLNSSARSSLVGCCFHANPDV
jgi:hypothetical protein